MVCPTPLAPLLQAFWLEHPSLESRRRHSRYGSLHTELCGLVIGKIAMSFLTHLAFSGMLLLALWAGFWSHQREGAR